MTTPGPALIVHGGAGADPADAPDELRDGVRAAVAAGWAALDGGGNALDAVEAAVRVLEDHPRFNAGRGSVLTSAGTVETDASIMEGGELRNGAVGAVAGVRNPITLARRILEAGRHSLFVGAGALERARALGIAACEPAELITDRQRERLAKLSRSASMRGAPAAAGTVGAAALDGHGRLAAATSTGGTPGKLPGRVGDSALIGCGTYADDRLGAVSCTGDGEAIIRVVLARRSLDLLRDGADPSAACRLAVDLLVREGRGQGGLIAVDPRGRVGWAQSTLLMPVGFRRSGDAAPVVPF